MMLRLAPFLFLAVVVVAGPPPWQAAEAITNSERLARNLPPLPPKFGRTVPGYARGVDNLTPAQSLVPRARPSSSYPAPPPPPPVIYTGRIEVRSAETNFTVGFLENTAGGINGIYLGAGEDLHVMFNTTASGKGPFDIVAEYPKFTGPVFLGGKTPNSSPVLGGDSGATVYFGNVEQTPPRSRPLKGPAGFEESSIWSIDPRTKKITAHWINPDGRPAPASIAYEKRENIIFFTGSLEKYNYGNDTTASLVEFFLASD